jgi:pimeloyl-ACP methyl ester carboxylesterase
MAPVAGMASATSGSYFVHQTSGSSGVIIFIHGVFGGADGTWRNEYTGAYWPELVARDPDFAVDDVYVVSYLTPILKHASNIEEISQRVLQQLDDRGLLNYNRIYFVAHSMGGLIVKRILVSLDKPSRIDQLHHVRAALLISTPSQGAPIAALGAWLSMNPQLKDMAPADFNTFLQALENDWQSMLRERDRAHQNYPQAFCAYETQATGRFRIVTRVYQATRCDNTPYAMDYNHVQVVKPRDINSDPYPWAKARIREADRLVATQARNYIHAAALRGLFMFLH